MIPALLADWIRARKARPLGAWVGWTGADTSQLALSTVLTATRKVLVLGGNRSGKTEWMRAVLVAIVLGSDHPDARLFWTHQGVDPDAFPRGPGTGWLIALTSHDSINYHRRWVDRLLPPGRAKWHNMNGPGPARVTIDVDGYEIPAEIVFKSEDQGEEAAQGASVRVVGHDEEGHTGRVLTECGVRLWDTQGWQIVCNTPIRGKTWLYHKWVASTPEGVKVRWLWTLDNPFIPLDEARKLEADPALAAARLRGEYVTLKGRVWGGFSRATHVCDPFVIPATWPRFRTIDFGTRNPFVCMWSCLTPDGMLIVYREHYQPGWTLSQHVTAMRLAEGWRFVGGALTRSGEGWHAERIAMTWADPEDPQQIMSLNVDHDCDVSPAINDVKRGLGMVAERLGSRGVLVFATCTHTIAEVEGYVWAGEDDAADRPDAPLKRNDHCCDTLRYACVGVAHGW